MSSNRNATVTVNTKANTSGIDKATQSLKGMDAKFKGVMGSLKQFKGALGGLAVVGIAKGILDYADKTEQAYKTQWLAEKSINDALYSNMTARGESQKAIDDQVKSYKELASELQNIGVIGDEVTLSGMGIMTQMGLDPKKVKEITPLIQDLATKQYGLNVSTEQYKAISQSVATMVNMGKLTLQGYGIEVSDVERKQFKAMSQADRYAFVQRKLKNAVAGTNEALAKTSSGKIAQMNNAIGDANEKVGQLVNTIKGQLATAFQPMVLEATGAFQELMDIINGADAPEDGYKFWSEEDANNLGLIRDNLKGISQNLSDIFNSDYPTLSAFLGTEQFLADLAKITNELNYVSGVISKLKNNMVAISNGEYDKVENPIEVDTNKRYATGTNYFEGGLTHVNENGGEIMNLPNGTQIIPHDISKKMASGDSNVTVNVNVAGNIISDDDYINQIGETIAGRVQLALSNI